MKAQCWHRQKSQQYGIFKQQSGTILTHQRYCLSDNLWKINGKREMKNLLTY